MIPKIIHYCWFGGKEHPESVEKCIESWKRYCPDYTLIEWNESNFDVNYNAYTQEAYKAGKYAFVSDVARLYALTKFGGIYFDTDVELIKPLDSLLGFEGGVTCFQSQDNAVSTGLLMCEKEFPFFEKFLKFYDRFHFLGHNGKPNWISNNNILTDLCLQRGLKRDNTLQVIEGLTIFPRDYFSPKNQITKEIRITENTYAIHYFDGSWYSEIREYEAKLLKKYKFLPKRCATFIAYTKLRGFRAAVRASKRFFKEKKLSKKTDKKS